jgi:hypothetical protein
MTTSTAAKNDPGVRTRPAKRARTTRPAGRTQGTVGGRPVLHAVAAAERAVRRESVHVVLPVVGRIPLPDREDLAFIGGVAVLVAIGLVEWPVGVALGVGHALAVNRHNKMVRAFGEALEEA